MYLCFILAYDYLVSYTYHVVNRANWYASTLWEDESNY